MRRTLLALLALLAVLVFSIGATIALAAVARRGAHVSVPGAHLFSDGVIIDKGMGDGTGFQHLCQATGTIAAGGTDIVVTWMKPFPDIAYTAVCTVINTTAGNEAGPYVERISARATTTLTVKLASFAVGDTSGNLCCIAVHD